MSIAAAGFDAVEAIAHRLNDGWDGRPDDLPAASGFLRGTAAGQRNRIVAYLLREAAAPSVGGRAAAVQVVTAEIGIFVLLPRSNDRGGAKAREKAGAWTDAIRQRLVGWTPPQGIFSRPIEWMGGVLDAAEEDGSYWVWIDRYRIEWTMDSQRWTRRSTAG